METEIIEGYDVIRETRKIRDRISAELEGLSPEEVAEYFRTHPTTQQHTEQSIKASEVSIPEEPTTTV